MSHQRLTSIPLPSIGPSRSLATTANSQASSNAAVMRIPSDANVPCSDDVALRSLRRSMASTGHDMMQPLQVVVAALERLGRIELDEDDRFWVDVANSQIHRISSSLSTLVEQSRVGVAKHTMRAFPIGDLLREVEQDWAGPARSAGVELTFVGTSRLVVSQRARLRSMIDNLVGNAIKYSPAGRILVGCRSVGGKIRVEVIDTGCGIAAADQERIFAPFCQIDPHKTGLGLGLALVREHCEELGHAIEMSSTAGRGSRFTILLDRADAAIRV